MDLSLTRLNRGQVQVQGEFHNFTISDEGFNQRLLDLKGHPKSGDYVIHLRITDDEGTVSERLYAIESKYTYKFLNRITLRKALQNVFKQYDVEVINAGLYFNALNTAYVHKSVVRIDHQASNDKELRVA